VAKIDRGVTKIFGSLSATPLTKTLKPPLQSFPIFGFEIKLNKQTKNWLGND
jgi:hypothetical protein